MIKYIVFDRDGTLIKHIPYLFEVSKVELLPSVKESIKLLMSRKFKLFLHTNQSGVARKYFKKKDAINCNLKMLELLDLGGDIFERTCIATDFPPDNLTYRKPSPKFGREIIKDYNIKKESLIYIGDSLSDIQAGANIGCKSIAVNTGLKDINTEILKINNIHNCEVYPSLLEAVESLLD